MLTDTPQDLRNFRSLLEHILARVEWHRDLFIFSQTAFDTLLFYTADIAAESVRVNMGRGGVMKYE